MEMVPRGRCTPSEHDKGPPVLARDREVFSGDDGISPAPAAVDTSKTKKQDEAHPVVSIEYICCT